jgi:uncharacterized protein (TIGR02246 family)
MMKRWTLAAALLLLAFTQAGGRGVAAQPEAKDAEAAAIQQALDAFAAAFNRADARASAARFTTAAEYTDETGEITRGRDAIQQELEALFADTPGLKLSLAEQSFRLIRPDVGMARGTATVSVPEGGSADGTFTAIFVKEAGDWKIDSLQEGVPPPTAAAAEELEQLGWLVGEWLDSDEDATIRTVGEWTKNRTFITRTFTVEVDGQVDLEGTQVIGWDPAAGRIRSWVFDSDGGFSEAVWTRKGDRWTITSSGVLPDGSLASEVNILTRLDDNRCTWASTERDHDGELLPDVKPVTLIRQAAAPPR